MSVRHEIATPAAPARDDVTRLLSRYLVSSRYEDIPRDVRHEASRAILNALGCAMGAARHETVENALAAVRPFSGE